MAAALRGRYPLADARSRLNSTPAGGGHSGRSADTYPGDYPTGVSPSRDQSEWAARAAIDATARSRAVGPNCAIAEAMASSRLSTDHFR